MTAAVPDRVEHIAGLYVGVFTASIVLGAFAGASSWKARVSCRSCGRPPPWLWFRCWSACSPLVEACIGSPRRLSRWHLMDRQDSVSLLNTQCRPSSRDRRTRRRAKGTVLWSVPVIGAIDSPPITVSVLCSETCSAPSPISNHRCAISPDARSLRSFHEKRSAPSIAPNGRFARSDAGDGAASPLMLRRVISVSATACASSADRPRPVLFSARSPPVRSQRPRRPTMSRAGGTGLGRGFRPRRRR